MKCFYNQTEDAVGICKSCGKGLCAEHAVDMERGLACKGHCEEHVRSLIALIENNVAMRATSQKLIEGSGRAGMVGAFFFLLMGVVFLVSGIVFWDGRGVFPVVIGGLFVCWSLSNLWRA